MADISRNQRYLLRAYERYGRGRGLDYGCGDGGLVGEAVSRGYDFWGVDPYYGDDEFRSESQSRTPDAAQDRIRLLGEANTIPWPDESFDWVCSGQVMEHVHDLDRAVAELARVTRPHGAGLHNFPTLENIREPHLGVPYFHRLPPRRRREWARGWYRLGVAKTFEHHSFDEWWEDKNGFFTASVVLRRPTAVREAFERYFDIQDVSVAKLSFHLGFAVPDLAAMRWLESRRHGVTLLMTRRSD